MSDTSLSPTEGTPVPPLRWPPPGLGRIQGDLWVVARKMAIVAAVLVIPLLVVLVLPQSPYGLGPLGEAWWIALLTTILGVALFADAVVSLVRFLSRVRRALAEGYAKHVVALVVSDRDRDNGFLLQGLNAFTPLSQAERLTLGRLRFLTPLGYLLAATWLVVGFGVLLLFAARGVASLSGVGFGTVAPAAIVAFGALVLRATEGTIVYRSREAWHATDWAEDLARQEIESWHGASDERGLVAVDGGRTGAPAWPRVALVGTIVGAFIAILPAMTLVPASAIGAIFSEIGGWSYERTLQRTASAEAYRSYRLEPDGSMSALEAGELLHVVARVGEGPHPAAELRAPVRSYDEPWMPELAPEGFQPQASPYWTDTIWTWVANGLTAEQEAFLRDAADHPARAEFARLASAPSLDLVGGFYELPFSEEVTFFALPVPRLSGLRSAANTHLGLAALQASEGRHAEARRTVQEVISAGFLLTEEAPLLMANYIGAVLVDDGGTALVRVLDAAGDAQAARSLEETARATRAAAAKIGVGRPVRPGGDAFLEQLPALAEDEDAHRGLRWEMAHLVTVFSPCANLRRVVFGPDDEYHDWTDRVRASLVRHDSEEDLYDVAMRGLTPIGEPSLLARFLALSMGGLGTRGSCAEVLAVLPNL